MHATIRGRRRRAAILFTVGALVAALLPLLAASPAKAAPQPVTAQIQRDGLSRDVDVQAFQYSGGSWYALSTVRMPDGAMALSLEPGTYTLRFYDRTSADTTYLGGGASAPDAQHFVVAEGGLDLGVVELKAPTRLTGTVRYASGAAFAGRVTLYKLGAYPLDTTSYAYVSLGWPGAGGEFSFPVSAGRYKVRFEPNSGRYFWLGGSGSAATSKALAESISVSDSDVALGTTVLPDVQVNQTVSGKAVLQTGAGAEGGLKIYAERESSEKGELSLVDSIYSADGTFSVELPPGRYKFQFHSYDYRYETWYGGATQGAAAFVTVGDSPVTLDSIRFTAPARVTGVIRDGNDDPLPDVLVRLRDSRNVVYDTTYTSFDGSYVFAGVQAGSYRVDATDAWAGEHVDVSSWWFPVPDSGDVAVPDLYMLLRGTISGTIRNEAGAPLRYVEVIAYDAKGVRVRSGVSDSTGSYTVPGLLAGSYRLKFVDPLGDYLAEFHEDRATLQYADPVTVRHEYDDVSGIDVTLAADPRPDTGVDLRGKVTDSAGRPLANVEVVADNGNDDPYDDPWAATNRSGRYVFTDLPTGSVKVHFSKEGVEHRELGYVAEWFDNRHYRDAKWVAVSADAAVPATANAALVRKGAFNGWLENPSGQSIQFGEVTAFDLDGDIVGSAQVVDSAFSLQVPPGRYYLRIDGWSPGPTAMDPGTSYVREWYQDARVMEKAQQLTVLAGRSTDHAVTLTADLEPLSAPRITGTPLVGKTLTASTGEFNLMAGNTYTYQWKRGARVVGTGRTYVPGVADAGARLTVTVTATHKGLVGRSTSAATAVIKAPSTTTVVATSPKRRVVKVVISVKATGISNPGGQVRIKRGSTTVRWAIPVVNGKATVELGSQPTGERKYSAVYMGSTKVVGSASRPAAVQVRR